MPPFLGTAYYLAGDRYPADRDIEQEICTRLRPGLPRIAPQHEWQGPETLPREIDARRDRLAASIGPATDAVLIGRSSGGRVATLLAMTRRVRAVVCFCYPFQAPSRVLETERFAHLAELAVPTLILQGTCDEYGGPELTERFRLSPSVHLRFLPGVTHNFALSPQGWDRVVAMVLAFIAAPSRPPAPLREDFDEADYLRRYPGLADAIADGRIRSGHEHYIRSGRREGRRYRLLPVAGPFAAGA